MLAGLDFLSKEFIGEVLQGHGLPLRILVLLVLGHISDFIFRALLFIQLQDFKIVLQTMPDQSLIVEEFMHFSLHSCERTCLFHMVRLDSTDPSPEIRDLPRRSHVLVVDHMPIVVHYRNSKLPINHLLLILPGQAIS